MRLDSMRMMVIACCILVMAAGGVGCKRNDKGGKTTNKKNAVRERSKQRENQRRENRVQEREDYFNNKKLGKSGEVGKKLPPDPRRPGGKAQPSARKPRVRKPERPHTSEAVAAAQQKALESLDAAAAHVGHDGSQLLVTYVFPQDEATSITVVMVTVTEIKDGAFVGSVGRIVPFDAEVPVKDGDPVSVARVDVIDWSLQVGAAQYGQFLRQRHLKETIDAGKDGNGKLATKLAALQAAPPALDEGAVGQGDE